MTVELWIPQSARKRFLRCDMPGCGREFPLTQRPQFERHVKACLKRNIDVLQAHAHRRDEMHGMADFDLELHEHLRKTGRLPSEA